VIRGGKRQWGRFAVDLILVAASAYLALFIRDNFDPSNARLQGLVWYSLLCTFCAAIVFSAARLNRALWRYVSLRDILHLIAAVTVALLLALLATFTFNRLDGVPRSLPVIQWFLLVTAMSGARIAARLLGEWRGRRARSDHESDRPIEHVLVIGAGDHLTELYLRSVAEFAPRNFVVEGILSPRDELHGRSMRSYKILGKPEDVRQIVAQLDVHGVTIDRLVVVRPPERLSRRAREGIEELEHSSIKIDWLLESLHLRDTLAVDPRTASGSMAAQPSQDVEKKKQGRPPSEYHRVKRIVDMIMVIIISIGVAPLLLLVALLVAVDVGSPLVFWQKRPGRYGRLFKMYKFRTMGVAHDAEGNRLPDEVRSSVIGRFLRRSRLDELPQLFNILVGEMSFVGPRPLLPADQPKGLSPRLDVRPGLTGWAQVNGGRDISPHDKAALDAWYVENATFFTDMKIFWHTLRMMVFGEGSKTRMPTRHMKTMTKCEPSNASEISTSAGMSEGP
jgi:lipopolysaccharide/colanic/teichoic acid biosynthesis glycosyltransferase